MKYYLDTEFDGPRLISIAIVSQTGKEAYYAFECEVQDEWVRENVIPVVTCEGATPEILSSIIELHQRLSDYLAGDSSPVFIADWPTDFQHFLPLLHDNMGNMCVEIPSFTCYVQRVDAYPTELYGAIQHNALWDARALRLKVDPFDRITPFLR